MQPRHGRGRSILAWGLAVGAASALGLSTLAAAVPSGSRKAGAHPTTTADRPGTSKSKSHPAKSHPAKAKSKAKSKPHRRRVSPPTTASLSFTVALDEHGLPPLQAVGTGHVSFATRQFAVYFDVPSGITPLLDLLPSSVRSLAPPALGNANQAQALVSNGTLYVSAPGLSTYIGGKDIFMGLHEKKAGVTKAFAAADRGFAKASLVVKALGGHHPHVTALKPKIVNGVRSHPDSGIGSVFGTRLKPKIVNGVRVHGWQVRSTPAAIAGQAPGVGILLFPLLAGLGQHVPVRVWAGPNGQLEEMAISVSHPRARTGIRKLTVVMTAKELGSGLTIVPPPSSQVKFIPARLVKGLTHPSAKQS